MNHNSGSHRDDQEVGVVHKVKSPKNQPQFLQMAIGLYWLGKLSPNKLSDQSCHGILIIWNFLLAD